MTSSQSQPAPSPDSIKKLIAKLGELEDVGDIGDKLHLTGEQIADVLWLTLELQKFATPPSEEEQELPEPDETTSTESSDLEAKQLKTDDKPITPPVSRQTETTKTAPEKKASVYTSSSFKESQGLPIGVPDAPSLRDPLNFAHGFRPLMRQVATGRKVILDEAATVKRIAEELILTVVMKAEGEQWLDLALVIDESHSMLIWGHTIKELKKMLKKYGIFRDMRIFGLQPDEAGENLQVFSRTGNNNRLIEPKEIIDPTGRRVVLIVSDCVSNIWRKGMMFPVLKTWTQKQPLAILQMLPEWMWRRTALDLGTAVGFKSSVMGLANQELSLHKPLRRSQRMGFNPEERSKVPVITLNWEQITQWSQMLVGKGDARVPGYLLPPELEVEELEIDHPLLKRQQQARENPDATYIVDNFQRFTSPLGRKLASLLAASPVICLPVVRLIQESLLPKSNQVQLAEVFLGGLLKPNSAYVQRLSNEANLNPDLVEYEFIEPKIRDIFLDDAPVSDSVDVVNAVSRYVAEKLGVSLSEFRAILKAPENLEEKKKREDVVKPFAEITAKILKRLEGSYARFAEEIEEAWEDKLWESKKTTSQFKIPIAVVVMTQEEAEQLDTGKVFGEHGEDTEDFRQFQQLKEALGIENLPLQYGLLRDEWQPLGINQRTIKEIINNLVEKKINPNRLSDREKVFIDYVSDLLIPQNNQFSISVCDEFRENGGIIVIDPISMYHPKIKELLQRSQLLAYDTIISIIVTFPFYPKAYEIERLLEQYIYKSALEIPFKHFEDFSEAYLGEFGVGSIYSLRRRVYEAIIRMRDRNFVPSKAQKEAALEGRREDRGIGSRIFGAAVEGRKPTRKKIARELQSSNIVRVKVSIAVVAMTQEEAEQLDTGKVFGEHGEDTEDFRQFQQLKKALGIEQLALQYGLSRDEWQPLGIKQRTIKEIIQNLVEEKINPNRRPDEKKLFIDYVSNLLIPQNNEFSISTCDEFRNYGGIIVIDPISMYHPKIKDLLQRSQLLGWDDVISIIVTFPFYPKAYEIERLLEEYIYKSVLAIPFKHFEDCSETCLSEFGVGSIHSLRHRIHKAILRIRDRNFVPSQAQIKAAFEGMGENKGIGSRAVGGK